MTDQGKPRKTQKRSQAKKVKQGKTDTKKGRLRQKPKWMSDYSTK